MQIKCKFEALTVRSWIFSYILFQKGSLLGGGDIVGGGGIFGGGDTAVISLSF